VNKRTVSKEKFKGSYGVIKHAINACEIVTELFDEEKNPLIKEN